MADGRGDSGSSGYSGNSGGEVNQEHPANPEYPAPDEPRLLLLLLRFHWAEFDFLHDAGSGLKNLDFKKIRCLRFVRLEDAAGDVGQITADCIVVVAVGEVDIEIVADVGNQCAGVQRVPSVGIGRPLWFMDFLDVVFVLDFADEFFENVFEGDDAGGTAVFVDDDGEMRLLLLEFGEEVADLLRFRRVVGWMDKIRKRFSCIDFILVQKVFRVNHTDNLVDGLIIDGNAAVAGFENQFDGVFYITVRTDGVDIDAGRHDFMDGCVIKFEGAGDDASFIFFNIIDIVRLFAFFFLVDKAHDFVFSGIDVLRFALRFARFERFFQHPDEREDDVAEDVKDWYEET